MEKRTWSYTWQGVIGLIYYIKQNDNENCYTSVKVKPKNVFGFPHDEDMSEPY